MIGDILPDGTFVVNEGERRYKAIRYLINQELETYPDDTPIRKVVVLLNPPTLTEKDRYVRAFTSQNKKKLKIMEIAYGALRLKEEFHLTHEQIAQEYGMSR